MLTMICLTTSVGAFRLLYVSLNARPPLSKDSLNQTLVNRKLERIPCFTTLSVWRLSGSNLLKLVSFFYANV